MVSNLSFLAGPKAYSKIREEGLSAGSVRVMPGAAGGPKWLVLSQLDRYLFGTFFADRTEPLFLLGASIGAWRFSSVCKPDPVAGIEAFEAGYLSQRYSNKPDRAEIDAECARILDAFFSGNAAQDILNHPFLRLSIMTVRAKGLLTGESAFVQTPSLLLAAFANALHRPWLHRFFERVLFSDPRLEPPFKTGPNFQGVNVPLQPENMAKALLASGSIPMVMSGVRAIPGAPAGVYRDGGVIDYHFDVPFGVDEGLVLFPHFIGRIIPGWFDKQLPWRKPAPVHMDRVLLVAPSPEFVSRLPRGKIPDRTDFKTYVGRDDDRIAEWKTVVDACKRLPEEFHEAVTTGKIREMVQPLFP